jgi:thiamine biosynthesis protein ThiI
MTNIHHHCKAHTLPAIITRDYGRIYLQTKNIPSTLPFLPNIFGITSFSSAITTTSQQKDLTTTAQKLLQPLLSPHTSFALKVTRTGNHHYTSQDIAIQIGAEIVATTQSPVDLTHPDIKLFIEIRHKQAYLFTQKIPGPGGLPLGTQGHTLMLIDTPHSLLAAWYIMRRGCSPIFILTQKKYQNNLISYINKWCPNTNPPIYLINQNKKFEELNHYAQHHHCDAIITDHHLTNEKDLKQIQHYKTKLHYPILHPLISMTETDIQQKITEVGMCH